MSLGTLGSTLNDELNRLANGGTYRDSGAMVDEALAAKQWANRENISPYSTDTVGVLNEIAGLGLDKKNWLDFNGVCNYIAGTSGLPAAAALRQIYPTTDLLTGVAAYYVDATNASASGQTITNLGNAGSLLPTTLGSTTSADSNDPIFLDHTGTNYVYLPGTITNYLEVPDAAALDITGDIDLRWYGTLDDWTPATQNELLAKQTLSNRSYKIAINSTGFVTFQWSADGSTVITATSTVVTGVTDGTAKWVRATLDVDNGASGNDVKFFLSDNGTSWTQLGSTVTNAGVTSIYVGTAPVRIGAIPDIGTTPLTGKVYRAQILNGIDGTTVLDVDTSVITAGSATSFTAVTGQTVTINRSTSGRKTVAVTQPTWLFGTDDYMEVNNRYMAHSTAAENYVYLSGASGNYMSVADNPPLDIAGDLDIQVKVALDDWTPSAENTLTSKWGSGQLSYNLSAGTDGKLYFYWSPNGSSFTSKASTVATGLTDGATKWVRVTFDVDNGASGNDIKFFTSDDGTTWTQLGATVTTAGIASIFNSTAVAAIGSNSNGNGPAKGKFFRSIIKNGIDGTVVLDADASVITLPSQTTFTDSSSNAYTVTINKSGVGTFVSTGNYLYIPYNFAGTNHLSSPDSAALDITGDLDLRIKVQADNWNNTAGIVLLNKGGAAGQKSYLLQYAGGQLRFIWSANGTAETTKVSTVTTLSTTPPGTVLWLRVTFDVDNGASGNTVTFYTSTDGINWTVYGAPVVTAGVTSIFNSTGLLRTGDSNGGNVFSGGYYRIQVLNGINGTLVFDANLESSITTALPTTFTESSSNAATVTVNYQGSVYRPYGVTTAGYLYPGATNTFAASATDFLNMGATDSFTALVVSRQANYSATQILINKGLGLSSPGYFIRNSTGVPANMSAGFNDVNGIGFAASPSGTRSNLALTTGALVRNTVADNAFVYANTNSNSSTDATTGSLATVTSLVIGSTGAIGNYADMELYAVAVFRQALTATQIRQITNYFANREVYL